MKRQGATLIEKMIDMFRSFSFRVKSAFDSCFPHIFQMPGTLKARVFSPMIQCRLHASHIMCCAESADCIGVMEGPALGVGL